MSFFIVVFEARGFCRNFTGQAVSRDERWHLGKRVGVGGAGVIECRSGVIECRSCDEEVKSGQVMSFGYVFSEEGCAVVGLELDLDE